jgi:hypothetical protein
VEENSEGKELEQEDTRNRPTRVREVTMVSPSSPKPGGDNSTGTLPKFRKWEASENGLLRI